MAVSYAHDFVVVGGTSTNLEVFDGATKLNFEKDTTAAIIILYDLTLKDPETTYAVSRVDWRESDDGPTKITGVRQVALSVTHPNFAVLFETDKDD